MSLSLKSELFRAVVSACMRTKGVLSCIDPFNGRTNQNGSGQLRIVLVTFRCSAGSRVTDAMLHAQAFRAVLIKSQLSKGCQVRLQQNHSLSACKTRAFAGFSFGFLVPAQQELGQVSEGLALQ